MGTAKDSVVIPQDGRTFLERICDEVDITFSKRVPGKYISVRSGKDALREGYVNICDVYEGIGPIGGIASVLEMALGDGYDAVLILACDLIKYDHVEAEDICAHYSGQDVLFARTDGTDVQPLASIWSVSALPAVRSQIESKDYRVRKIADFLDNVGYYDSDRSFCYENRNTPFES